MLAAVMEEIAKPLVVKEMADPELTPDGVIIKVEANGICRSDWHLWQGHFDWVGLKMQVPHIFGHELSGIVEEVGSNVKNYKKGDRVVVPVSGGDGVCEMCRQGHQNLCDHNASPGVAYWGGFGEYVHVPAADFNLAKLPESVDFIEASAIGCRFATAFHGVMDRAKVQGGEWVVVAGCGGVGLSAIQVAVAVGASVIAVDIDDKKLELAKQLGAVATINSKNVNVPEAVREITKGGAHVSIDALGITATSQAAVLSLRKRGRHLQLGMTSDKEQGFIPMPIDMIVAMELNILGSYGSPAFRYNDMLQMVANGILKPKELVTQTINIHEVNSVMEAMTTFDTTGLTILNKWR
ncbi:alcohol dehydrogenase catalytic domain-containing protein [Bacillus sp. B15-48]|uniref:alcohol dehydrogenase catalytic domain-containing protein n=1 Tax=Bacillus sp. B15-48 TaxID=1548601 RepID=UPI00193FB3E1|nr:alcohol dehydrogenase catalytic domain-containing protein [Bacillus sp. B15-48]MBM4763343.1 alcohol dehydrogenase catalytic domain-containing protein [Bacillus sp. B15-48]